MSDVVSHETTERKTVTQCRLLAASLWPDAQIRLGGVVDGLHTLDVWATVPSLRGTTCAVRVAKRTDAGAWRSLLAMLLRRAAKDIDAHRAHAENYDARAQRERDHATTLATVVEEVRRG